MLQDKDTTPRIFYGNPPIISKIQPCFGLQGF